MSIRDPFDLNLRHLRALDAIIRLGSMSAAADEVGISQPALTQGLAKLEQQVGALLFDRRPDGVQATALGTTVATRATAALGHLREAGRIARRSGGRGFGRPDTLMTSTQLRAFLAVADHGGFVGAATASGLSAPSLHRATRDLEQIGQMPLLENRGRGVILTAAGRRLARGIRLAAGELAAAIYEVSGEESALADIAVGAMPLARANVLPRAIAAYLADGPRAGLRIVEGSWRELIEPLRDGVIDMTIGALRDTLPLDLEQRPLFQDELVAVGRAGHPLQGADPTIADLRRFDWVVPSAETPLRAQWRALFDPGPLPAAPIVCGSTMVIRGILAGSDLLTLLSPDQVAVEIASGLLAVVARPGGLGTRTIGVTVRRGWRPTAPQDQFLSALEAVARTRIPKNL